MRIRQDESGQVLVLTALSMAAILGFLALAIDVGLLFNTKRDLQIAADAAATAAALDYSFNASTSSATTVADLAANANWVATSNVTVNFGSSGSITTPYHNSAGYVEVIISQPSQTFFMRAFSLWTGGNSFASVPVAARAVAGSPGPSYDCGYVTDPHMCGALSLQGSFTFCAPNCGIVVDSDCSSGALSFTGNGGSLVTGSISVVGGVGGMHSGESSPVPVTGATPINDPLANRVFPPSVSGLTCNPPPGSTTKKGVTTGTLTGTLTSSGTTCYSGEVTLSNVTLSGLFVFTGDVTLDGAINSGAAGTTLDLNSGSLSENTGTVMNIIAPTSGADMGIALMAPLTNTSTLAFDKGASSGSFTGIIYAPGMTLTLNDSGGDKNGGLAITSDLVVDNIQDKTATITINSYSQAYPQNTPLTAVSLVE
jgi:Flp pilus assembly protein TadG